jgi:hypothetical protein
MRIGSKGQGAMEYLMTYGWAILVVMIVGVVLWQLGIFSGTGGGNKAIGLTGTKIGVIDATIKCDASTSILNFTMTNQAGGVLSNIEVTPSGSIYDTVDSTFGDGTPASNLTSNGRNTLSLSTTATSLVGDKTTTDLTITFNERVAGEVIPRTVNGQIMCTVEA